MKTSLRFLVGLLVLVCSLPSMAATEWFATNNVAAGAGSGTYNDPWNPNYAFWQPQVQPGDIITLKGTAATVYTNWFGFWNHQAWYWQTGTTANPITIRAENNGIILRAAPGGAGGAESVFQIGSQVSTVGHEAHDIIISGFKMDGTNCGTTGTGVPVMKISVGNFITITNCELFNSPGAHGILIADATSHNIKITHSKIYSNAVNTANTQPPHGAYLSGATYSNIIEYCEIYGHTNTYGGITPMGIHVYSDQGSSDIIRYNYLHDNNRGIGLFTGTNHLAYGNIIDVSGAGAVIGAVIQTKDVKFYHNTLYGGTATSGSSVHYGLNLYGANTLGNSIVNNLIRGFRGDGIRIESGTPASSGFTNNLSEHNGLVSGQNYNDASGAQVISGNFFGNQYDSLLTASPNFVPQAGSTARNNGISFNGYNLSFGGVVVPQESAPDIGAQEYNSGGQTPTFYISSYPSDVFEQGPVGGTVRFSRTDTTTQITNTIAVDLGTAVMGTHFVTQPLTNVLAIGVDHWDFQITPINVAGTTVRTVGVRLVPGTGYSLGSPTNVYVNINPDTPASSRRPQWIKQ